MGSNKTKIKKEKIKGYSYLQKIIADKELLGVWSKMGGIEMISSTGLNFLANSGDFF